jgi:hypothetical protein
VKKESFDDHHRRDSNDHEEDEDEENYDNDDGDGEMNDYNNNNSNNDSNNNNNHGTSSDTIKDTINAISSLAWNTNNHQKSSTNHHLGMNNHLADDNEDNNEEFDEDVDEEDEDEEERKSGTHHLLPAAMMAAAAVAMPAGRGAKKEVKHVNKNHFNYKITHAGGSGAKNADDGGRAVKFYDDFIDFRGDILRRPPNSKNCRILWEYLFLLLQDTNYSSVIKWEDDVNMVFRIVQAEKLAALWGKFGKCLA